MKTLTTLSQDVFNSKASEMTQQKMLRKEISLSEFKVIDNTHIDIDGVSIEMNDKAYKELLFRLRLPRAFTKRWAAQFGNQGLAKLIEVMKADRMDKILTLIVDPSTRQIVDVLPAGYASISNEAFVNFASRYIDQYGLDVTNMGHDSNGGVSIDCVSNKLMTIPGFDNEVFKTGVQFRNTPRHGVEVSPYLNRLWCTNGCSAREFSENFKLNSFDEGKIQKFNEHMINMASNNFQPMGAVDQIKKAMETDASLAEMQRAMNSIMRGDKSINFDYLQRYIPIERSKREYDKLGADTSQFTKAQMKNAKSGVTVWDVVNGMTNFASNETRFKIKDGDRSRIMLDAGSMLMKKEYDTEVYVPVDPFANRQLLNEDEVARMRGDQ